MEVSYKDINIDMNIEEDEIEIEDISSNINEFEIVKPEIVDTEDQVTLDFDMPISKREDYSDKIVHELIEEVNDIFVNDPVHIIPVNEVDGSEIKKFGIDDYIKLKDHSSKSEPKENKMKDLTLLIVDKHMKNQNGF